MDRCPLTYALLARGERYSEAGLRMLSPNLANLVDFPYTIAEQLEEAARLAGKISIQGIQPKLSVRLEVKNATFAVVEKGGTFIVKPQNPLWPDLPENEDLTMRMAAAAAIETPFHGLLRCADSSLSYFIRRFDRIGRGAKLPLEDFAQLSGRSRETKYDSSMERVAEVVERHVTFPLIEKARLFSRLLFAFLVGNEDMHLKNFSLISREDRTELSPVYDMLNTTIVLPGEVEEMALPLHGKKRDLTRRDILVYYGQERLGLNQASVDKALSQMADARKRWVELIHSSFLPARSKDRYLKLVDYRLARLGL
jgi:serine/threonine-protein kinase HipA